MAMSRLEIPGSAAAASTPAWLPETGFSTASTIVASLTLVAAGAAIVRLVPRRRAPIIAEGDDSSA